MLDLCPGLGERERRIGRLMLNNTSAATYEVAGELVTWVGVPALAEALCYSDGGVLASVARAVKRARARLVQTGILVVIEHGGRGRSSTTRFGFSLARLCAFEGEATRAGVLQRFGASDEGVTLSACRVQGDAGVTLNGAGEALPKGDTGGQGGGHVTLTMNSPCQGDTGEGVGGSIPVDKHGHPVGNHGVPVDMTKGKGAAAAVRVTGGAAKGDKSRTVRVTPQSPEPLYNPDKPIRVRGSRKVADGGDRRQRDLPLMRQIRGGLSGVIDAVQHAADVQRDAHADRRHDAVLERATKLFGGDRQASALAVSTLQSDVIGRLRAGWVPDDDEFQGLVDQSIASLRNAGLIEDASSGAREIYVLRNELRIVQEQVGEIRAMMHEYLKSTVRKVAAFG